MQSPHPIFKVVAGPFIVENKRVLLVREQKSDTVSPWILPGGKFELQDTNLEDTVKREAQEELGLTVTLGRVLKPVVKKFSDGTIGILIAYIATHSGEIKPGSDIATYEWHSLENLPPDCEENIYHFVADYKTMI